MIRGPEQKVGTRTVMVGCYRWLCPGHTWRRCTSLVDRSDRCYRCGASGYHAVRCLIWPRCLLCADLGRLAEHILRRRKCVLSVGLTRSEGLRLSAARVLPVRTDVNPVQGKGFQVGRLGQKAGGAEKTARRDKVLHQKENWMTG